jgi:ribose 5-phosphate isomerase A
MGRAGAGRAEDTERLKRLAAERAVELVEPGMVLGLGTGSTAALALEAVARRLAAGALERVRGVATSGRTRERALALRIPLVELDEVRRVDLTIDGADEVDPRLDLIKGLGGALVREKIVAAASRRFVVVVGAEKLVERLGVRTPLPVEVVQFGLALCEKRLRALGSQPALRRKGSDPFVTDNGNYILDCRFGAIDDPASLDTRILSIPGALRFHGGARARPRGRIGSGPAERRLADDEDHR